MADMKTIVIQGESFDISTPYAEGHALTEIEAKVLNQVRCENVRNNQAKAIKEAKEAGTFDLATAQSAVAEYDSAYEFSAGRVGGSTRTMDPIEREAKKIAREAIKAQLAAQGRKLGDVDKDKLAAAIATAMENADILKLAKKRVADQQKLLEATVDLIGVE
jgi:hypothetical protein